MEDIWRGIDANGGEIQIGHSNLMKWARREGQEFQVGWCTAYTTPNGDRLVRFGEVKDAIKTAEENGWHDIADLIRNRFAVPA